MTFIPGCDRDVFISYAHDNDHDGWVTRFQKGLAAKLAEYLGAREKPSIWFDDRNLRAGDPVSAEIHLVLERTASMVSVITPSYLSSSYCVHEELEHFWRTTRNEGRVIIQAIKVPLRPGQQVPLPEIKYIEFLDRLDNGDVAELEPGDPRFSRTLNKLANQLGTHLEDMRRKRQAIFIGEGQDPALLDATQLLRSELHGHGYRVGPDERVAEFTTDVAIRDMLEGADLSVHFFSGNVDTLARRQFDIACTLAKPMVLVTLVPLDTTTFPAVCGLPVLIASQSGTAALAGDWKPRAIDQIRKRLQPPDLPEDSNTDAPLTIYVHCESKADLADAQDLMDALRERGCEVLRPDFRILDPARRQADHDGKLARADGVVLFGAAVQTSPPADPALHVIGESPAAVPARAGVHALGDPPAGVERFLEAVRARRVSARRDAR